MNTVPQSNDRLEAPLFLDGLGERVVAADGATGELLQILRIRQSLTAVPSFEFALRERTARLANFRHAYYARVRRVDRMQVPGPGLAIVSDHVEGTRLADILRVAHERQLQLDINAALCLIRQLVPAVALLHENAREVAHGLIAPERLVVTPHARLVIVEHVLAAAVEQLQFGRERLWQEFRIAMPPSAGLPRFDHRADVTGIGVVALSLVLGRPLEADEFPQKLPALLNDARERTALGEEQPLSAPLRDWLARALQLDIRRAFASAPEALAALEEIVADDSMYVAAPVALETFLSRYIAALLEPVAEPLPAVAPVPMPAVQAASRPAVPEPPPAPAFVPPAPPPAPPVQQEPSSWAPAGFAALQTPVAPPPVPPAAAVEPRYSPVPPAVPPAAEAAAAPVPAVSAREITELISAKDLSVPGAPAPLFNPDAPFTVPMPEATQAQRRKRRLAIPRKAIALVVLVAALGGAGWYGRRFIAGAASSAPETGTLVVESNPAGVQVFVDGIDRGLTPAKVSVPPGAHILELRGRGVPRVIPFTMTAGAQISQYLEFANTPETGQMRIESQPPGARVLVDGADRGVAPLTVTDLMPGDHEVVLQAGGDSARHVVNVQAGGMASLVAPVAAGESALGGPVSGWLSIKAPFSMEIREGGRVIGTTEADRVMMAAGKHDVQLVNEALGFQVSRSITIQPGKVASLAIEPPNGVVNLNANPWAEVWIDGQRVGETPIGNLSVPVGPHEIVFRHPQFGEKRHAVSVTLGAPVRVSVDMK